jgi:hypothetical protein
MCQATNLAARGPVRIDRCTCGCLHLHLGPVMMRIEPLLLPVLLEVAQVANLRLSHPSRWGAPPEEPRMN